MVGGSGEKWDVHRCGYSEGISLKGCGGSVGSLDHPRLCESGDVRVLVLSY